MNIETPNQGNAFPAELNAETPSQWIGVHVGNSVMMPFFTDHLPQGNWIGASLLSRVLELALQAEGLTQSAGAVTAGDLNDCVLQIPVSDTEAAAEIIIRELKNLLLLQVSQIGVQTGSGWRCIYPSPSVRMDFLMDTERHSCASADLIQHLHKLEKALTLAVKKIEEHPPKKDNELPGQ